MKGPFYGTQVFVAAMPNEPRFPAKAGTEFREPRFGTGFANYLVNNLLVSRPGLEWQSRPRRVFHEHTKGES